MNLRNSNYVFKHMQSLVYLCRGIYFILLMLFLSCNHVKEKSDKEYANSSGIVLSHYDEQTIDNLSLLCKVWGFAKYYHPDIVEGKCNWDFELFRVMPSLLETNSKKERNKILYQWIKKLPKVDQTREFITVSPDSIKMYPDIDWIEDEAELGIKLSQELVKIKYAKRDYNTFSYLSVNKPPFYFNNENPYSHLTILDAGYRLLSLFRYWNIIQYYFPYKYLIEEDWKEVIPEFIPQMLDAKDKLEYQLVMSKLISRIHDSHAYFKKGLIIYDEFKFGMPVEVKFVEGKALITNVEYHRYSLNSNILKKGDVILSVDDLSVDSIIQRESPFISASNYPVLLRDIAPRILNARKERVLVKYERNGEVFSDSLRLYPITTCQRHDSYALKPPYEILSGNIGYLNLGSCGVMEKGLFIKSRVPDSLNTKGLIIDLRLYPRGAVVGYDSYDLLYPEPTDFAKFTHGNALNPGLFTFRKKKKAGKVNPGYYKGKKVILVNEETQSHAEFMTMKYRCAPNTVVIGSMTAGADGNIGAINLPGGLVTGISSFGIYYPDGTETQRVGIIPDIEVKPTIKGIREGRDEVLERAIQILNDYCYE